MRKCRLTLGTVTIVLCWLAAPHLYAAVDPLMYDVLTLDEFGGYAPLMMSTPPPQGCEVEDGCDCIADWVVPSYWPNRYVGNAYRFTHARRLDAFDMALQFSGTVDLCFSIHRKLANDEGGDYQVVWMGTHIGAAGTGTAQFHSSGPIIDDETNDKITLEAGYTYALGVHFDAGTQSVGVGFTGGDPGSFTDYTVVSYLLLNSPAFASGCPDDTLSPGGSGAQTLSARLCLVPEPGACCWVDPEPVTGGRKCDNVLETACAGAGSYFHGQGTTCAEVLCDFGACCDACGGCKADYTPQACTAEGETHTPGATCDDPATLCPVTTGACCTFSDCQEVCRDECEALPLATFYGEGTTCDPNVCVGACCVDAETGVDDGCVEYTQSFCEEWMGGTYRGDGTTCLTLAPDDICGGACCFAGGCIDDPALITSRANCTQIPGGVPGAVYLGDGTSCPPDEPPDPSEDCPTFAAAATGCCLPNGTCIDTLPQFCNEDWVQGDDGGTTPFTCTGTCAVGACCYSDGSCEEITQHACITLRGGESWTVDVACEPDTCPPPVRACCAADATCTPETQGDCTDASGVFRADSSGCPPGPDCTPFGACCLGDGECIDQIASSTCTTTYGGDYHDGIACDSQPCPDLRGACCTSTGTCQFILDGECTELAGDFQGVGVDCVDAGCPVAGACCTDDGCVDVIETDCVAPDGIYQGDGTSCDEAQRCELGACCDKTDGSCDDTRPPQECPEGEVFAGVGTKCAEGACDPGRCCKPDGTCEDDVIDIECAEPDGPFTPGVACADDPVCDPAGACCLVDEACAFLTEAACVAEERVCSDTLESCGTDEDCDGGVCVEPIYIGDDVACNSDPDLCERGSCCSCADGGCAEDVIEFVCSDEFDNFTQSLGCVSIRCERRGSCCRGDGWDGDCAQSDGTCDSNGWVWESDCQSPFDTFYPTSDCPAVCEPKGACCRQCDGVCDEAVLESDCAGEHDVFHADRTCGSVGECAELGTCCRDGVCTEESEADCVAEPPGVYLGLGCDCELDPCWRVGACCSRDHGCTDNVLDVDCPAILSQDDCPGAKRQEFFGGVTCGDVSCELHGPCCLAEAVVLYATQEDCIGFGGSYGGDGAVCEDSLCTPGACCLPDVGSEACDQRTVQACEFEGGGFLGENALCPYTCSDSGRDCLENGVDDCDKACSTRGNICESDDDCNVGRCEGTANTLCDVNAPDCGTAGICANGDWCTVGGVPCAWGSCEDGSLCLFDSDCGEGAVCDRTCLEDQCTLDESCEPIETCVAEVCTRGACCRPDGTCDDDVAEVQCSGPSDKFHAGVDGCDDVTCVGVGACCVVDDEQCYIMERLECTVDNEGSYLGDGSGGQCDLVTDLCVVRACCLQSPDRCEEWTRLECERRGGIYQEDEADCATAPDCARGSCCPLDGTCMPNTVISQCSGLDDDFRAGDISCDPACIARGACCTGLTCAIETAADCVLAGSAYYTEDGLACSPNPCCPGEPAVVWVDPPGSVVDARQPRTLIDETPLGIDTIVADGPSNAHPDCWTLCETLPGEAANSINSVSEARGGGDTSRYTIDLDRKITTGAVTKITYKSWDVTTDQTIVLTSLPGDSSGDGNSNTDDLAILVECCLNDSCASTSEYSCDIDQSGGVSGGDILRLIDLLTGVEPFDAWYDASPYDEGECP